MNRDDESRAILNLNKTPKKSALKKWNSVVWDKDVNTLDSLSVND